VKAVEHPESIAMTNVIKDEISYGTALRSKRLFALHTRGGGILPISKQNKETNRFNTQTNF
jgi:hypothetical protein